MNRNGYDAMKRCGLGGGIQDFQVGDDVRHRRPFFGVLVPHPLHEIDGFGPPVFPESGSRWSTEFLANGIVDVVLVVALPRILLSSPSARVILKSSARSITLSPVQPDSISQKTRAAENTSTL